MKQLFCLLLMFSTWSSILSAQKPHNYADHKPEYKKWLDSYILDKIEYRPTSTVFYFRFVCDNAYSGGAIFYPPGGKYPWYLKGKDVQKEFEITAVKNIRQNGVLIKELVQEEPFNADADPFSATGYTIFSCEIHFDRLDDDMKVADLIEGKGQEHNKNHFNCFNIKLKTWNDKDLGNEQDSKAVVRQFEEKYTNKTTISNAQPSIPQIRTLQSAQDLICEQMIVLNNIKFHDNSTKFKGIIAAKNTLHILFNYLKKHPKVTLTLYGHSDVFGSEERNMELSRQRVIKIQRWLTLYGIKTHRINYQWFGPQKPLVKDGSVLNRRVEIKLSCP